jgi:hypothetical protein
VSLLYINVKTYYLYDELQREDRPAVEDNNGDKFRYLNGEYIIKKLNDIIVSKIDLENLLDALNNITNIVKQMIK